MGVGKVIARPTGAAPPWFNVVDDGNVVVGASICADPNGNDDIVHRPGMVDSRDFSDYLVVK
jgi:hypothetical protein